MTFIFGCFFRWMNFFYFKTEYFQEGFFSKVELKAAKSFFYGYVNDVTEIFLWWLHNKFQNKSFGNSKLVFVRLTFWFKWSCLRDNFHIFSVNKGEVKNPKPLWCSFQTFSKLICKLFFRKKEALNFQLWCCYKISNANNFDELCSVWTFSGPKLSLL